SIPATLHIICLKHFFTPAVIYCKAHGLNGGSAYIKDIIVTIAIRTKSCRYIYSRVNFCIYEFAGLVQATQNILSLQTYLIPSGAFVQMRRVFFFAIGAIAESPVKNGSVLRL